MGMMVGISVRPKQNARSSNIKRLSNVTVLELIGVRVAELHAPRSSASLKSLCLY